MKIYHYNRETKEYMGSSDARLDPLELKINKKEIYMFPAQATFDAPPDAEPGKARVFDGAWVQVEDNRGKTVWNIDGSGGSVILTALGPIPEGWTEQTFVSLSKWNGSEWVPDQNKTDDLASATAKATLAAIDLKSIRSLREYVSFKNDAPQILKDYEAQAVEERKKVK